MDPSWFPFLSLRKLQVEFLAYNLFYLAEISDLFRDFFDQTPGGQDANSTFSTASIENPEVPQTTFFCNSSGVRLHQCALYAIDRCAAGFFELPEKPSGQYLKALEILRNPSQGLNDTVNVTESSSEVAITYTRRSHQPDYYSPAECSRTEGQRCPLPAAENRSLTPTHVPREGVLS
ncbi:hypothetical protein VKT23_020317 [Stygiomarasmius scandens]|uniref:Uncharacterized protein n=1 Tax=Marasmiellus scandens TaxID=2682957 RepID=A0ABR1IMR8_9AGAR